MALTFQFQTGSIKSEIGKAFMEGNVSAFQFQTGSIKSVWLFTCEDL